ncbi:MAG: protein kinase, partial [Gammaproteobacteria bacterium]|nr:protein kinase [Gammaproteobacteria bacterium]
RKLFFNEAKMAGMLRHPNIVATLDAGIEDGLRYLVMEYVGGAQTLDPFTRPDNLLPVQRVIEILIKCALALDYAHSKGVIHRDIKPKNVMLSPEGEVKLGDFGIALIDRADVDETQVIGALGSPRYMSPEQVMADTVTNQSDIFSLGIVAYELLTGRNPFAARTVAEIAKNILREPHQPLLQIRQGIPERLAGIVDRTLKKHPAGRYNSALDLAGDLSLIYDDLELSARETVPVRQRNQLRGLAFFREFDDGELGEMMGILSWHRYEPGQLVMTEGEADDHCVIVLDGALEVRCGPMSIATLKAGAAFGDCGLVPRPELSAELVARESSSVLRLRASGIRQVSLNARYRFYRALSRSVMARLQHLMRRINKRARRHAEQAASQAG